VDEDLYAEVDGYLDGLFGPPDPVLRAALDRAEAAGLPAIQVSATHGRLLHVLALARGARSILEIGTLAGYSTIWLARALPEDGHLVSIEHEPRHAEVARTNLASAGLADRTEVRVGPAIDVLADLERTGEGPFDLVFIDADKPPYADYLEAAVRLSRPGTLIVADNVVRRGRVLDADSGDDAVEGLRRFNAAVARDPRLTSALVQTIGAKNHDGLAFAVVGDLDAR
jgi:caffeoyl-CoA O-methyltransferase